MCVFSQLEPCNTFSFLYGKEQSFVKSAWRKCLHIYYYFMDREFGLIHVMVQTCFPCGCRSVSTVITGLPTR